MRSRNKQRVHCEACAWSGGRAEGERALTLPCFKCGGPVVAVGPVYLEVRSWAGCRCGWHGEISTDRIGGACVRCGAMTEPAFLVLDSGQVLA
jgi:hypothetical protein